jgi:hypothetical protein
MFLQLDHVHNDGAKERAETRTSAYMLALREGFPDRYQLLCANCNSGKARNGGVCPHHNPHRIALGS